MAAYKDYVLTWSPSVNNIAGQAIQYRIAGDTDWIDLISVSIGTSMYVVTLGEDDYDFRILATCISGEFVDTNIFTVYDMGCPIITISGEPDSIVYSFIGDDVVDRYEIELYGNGIRLVTQGYNTPYGGLISDSFEGLDYSVVYTVRAVLIKGTEREYCGMSTSVIPVCVLITDIEYTIS